MSRQADAGRDCRNRLAIPNSQHEQRGQGNINFPCSADHERDWQPYPVDPYSCYMCDHTYIHHKYVRGLVDWKLFVYPFQRINSSIINSINSIDSINSINSVNIIDSVNSISLIVLVANTMNYFITLQYCCQSSSSWSVAAELGGIP